MRYAIYYMPQASSPLARFGSSVLGYDAETGTEIAYPDDPVFLDPAALGWTAAPRRYGFHATLKAPFTLAAGRSVEDLVAELEAFAADRTGVPIKLRLASLDQCLALVPAEPSAALMRLADDCVRVFDDFRAPLTASDRERRHPERLSPALLENLDRWGYPHVFEEFQFHMTLTGSLDGHNRLRLEPVLGALFDLVPAETRIDALALLQQPSEQERFRVVARFPFGRT